MISYYLSEMVSLWVSEMCSFPNFLFSYISIPSTHFTLCVQTSTHFPIPILTTFLLCKCVLHLSWIGSNLLSTREYPWIPCSILSCIYLKIHLNSIHIFILVQIKPHGNYPFVCLSTLQCVSSLEHLCLCFEVFIAQCLTCSVHLEMLTEWANEWMKLKNIS